MFWQGHDDECVFCPYKRKADEYDIQQRAINYKPEQPRPLTLEEREVERMRQELIKINSMTGPYSDSRERGY